MCDYVGNILVPYWTRQKELVGAPDDQECILQLDIWSVHKSIQFCTGLSTTSFLVAALELHSHVMLVSSAHSSLPSSDLSMLISSKSLCHC
ncbi:hypothetical protein BDR07DRAFT_1550325 [Suillus spraguei]|nr:hypothetical protein BDR07DRAFT_1550325 [Suillus spraguei]